MRRIAMGVMLLAVTAGAGAAQEVWQRLDDARINAAPDDKDWADAKTAQLFQLSDAALPNDLKFHDVVCAEVGLGATPVRMPGHDGEEAEGRLE